MLITSSACLAFSVTLAAPTLHCYTPLYPSLPLFTLLSSMFSFALSSTFSSTFFSLSALGRLRPRRAKLLVGLACLGGLSTNPSLSWADGLEQLQAFIQQARAGTAQFTQTVTAPRKAGEEQARVQVSQGQFSFQRPGQFKFIYTKPFAQSIVANGQTLWLYDPDLEQVTQRRQEEVLTGTAAALLTSATSLAALERDFALYNQATTEEADRTGQADQAVQWVRAIPKKSDSTLQSLRVGFVGTQLVALEMLDSFGQHSQLRFEQMQLVPQLPASAFELDIPPGVDVLVH